MARSSSGFAERLRGTVVGWVQGRVQECVRCAECDQEISPLDTCCPRCGQGNPARVSLTAPAYLVLGFVLLAITLVVLIKVF